MQVKTHQLHLVLFHHQKSIDLEKGSSLTPRSLWLSRCVGTNDLEKVYLRLAPENTSLIKAVILLEAKTNCWKYMEMKYIISTKCYVLYLKNILTLYPWIRNRTNILNTQILTQICVFEWTFPFPVGMSRFTSGMIYLGEIIQTVEVTNPLLRRTIFSRKLGWWSPPILRHTLWKTLDLHLQRLHPGGVRIPTSTHGSNC